MSEYKVRDVALRQSLTALVELYQAEIPKVQAAYAQLQSSQDAFRLHFSTYSSTLKHRGAPKDDLVDVLASLTQDAWRVIIEHMELRKIASLKRSEEVETAIAAGKMPPLTVENVYALLQAYSQNLGEIQKEACLEVYTLLTPGARHRDYKTNSRYGIGPTAILQYAVEEYYTRNHQMHVDYRHEADLIQIERVFCNLDGQAVVEGYKCQLIDAINTSPDGRGETTYFRFRACQNRNLHLWFKRLDLVATLNAIAADGYSLKS